MNLLPTLALLVMSAGGPTEPDQLHETIRAVLADADSHARPLRGGFGYEDGFFIGSVDDRFHLTLGGYTQIRWSGSHQINRSGVDRWVQGFELRRTRLVFSGHIGDPTLEYRFSHAFSRSNGLDRLSDGYLRKTLDDGLTLQVGQFKLPFTAEELLSAKKLLGADRSLTNRAFTLRRSRALQVGWGDSNWRSHLALSSGADASNTQAVALPTRWALTLRSEWRPQAHGSWRDFDDTAAVPDEPLRWRLGVAVHYQEDEAAGTDPGGQWTQWTADATYRGHGWSGLAAIIGQHRRGRGANAGTHDYGVVGQLALTSSDSLQPFVRFDMIIPDSDRGGDDSFATLTAGATHFVEGHDIRLSAETAWFLDAGAENDLVTELGEVMLRVQLQLVF